MATLTTMIHPVLTYKTGDRAGQPLKQLYAQVPIDKINWADVQMKLVESTIPGRGPIPVMQYRVEGKYYDVMFKSRCEAESPFSYFPRDNMAKDKENWTDSSYWAEKQWSFTVNMRGDDGVILDEMFTGKPRDGSEDEIEQSVMGIFMKFAYENSKAIMGKSFKNIDVFKALCTSPAKENEWTDKDGNERTTRRLRLKVKRAKAGSMEPLLAVQKIVDGKLETMEVKDFCMIRDAVQKRARCIVSWIPSFYVMGNGCGVTCNLRSICVANPVVQYQESTPVYTQSDIADLIGNMKQSAVAPEPTVPTEEEETVEEPTIVDDEEEETKPVPKPSKTMTLDDEDDEVDIEEEYEEEEEEEPVPPPKPVKKAVTKKATTTTSRK